MELKPRIKQLLHGWGFELVGFTRPDPPPHLDTFLHWIAEKRHADMAYLASERAIKRRSDPRQILPNVKTILVAGMRYANPTQRDAPITDSPTGKVAAYAWGPDYHDVIVPLLEKAASQIAKWTGQPVVSLAYSDTGAILERDYAMQAGLGWIGKNTCLISPRSGSYFLLGVLLLELEIEADEPFTRDQCGSCRRCIDACPTGCILPDRTLDSARCISYLTIENKKAIPTDLREKMGEWVFGCDICQQVCPWNLRFAKPGSAPALAAQQNMMHPRLIEELALTEEAFREKYHASPLLRPKRRGYLRNVAVALGNSNAARSADALVRCLREEPEALVRAHAAWALGQLGFSQARLALREALAVEQDAQVRSEIASALARLSAE